MVLLLVLDFSCDIRMVGSQQESMDASYLVVASQAGGEGVFPQYQLIMV